MEREYRLLIHSYSVGQKGEEPLISRTKSVEQRTEDSSFPRTHSIQKGEDTLFSSARQSDQRGEESLSSGSSSAEQERKGSFFDSFTDRTRGNMEPFGNEQGTRSKETLPAGTARTKLKGLLS